MLLSPKTHERRNGIPGLRIFLTHLFLLLILLLPGQVGCSGGTPVAEGVSQGNVMPCGDTPNCVFTAEIWEDYTISPLRYNGTRDEAVAKTKEVLEQMPNITLRYEKEDYLWWECSSQIFGFVDDLESICPWQSG